MKKIILGLLLGLTVSVSQAALTIVNPSSIEFSGYGGQPEIYTGSFSAGQWGYLSASTAGTFTATYLGNESGFINFYVETPDLILFHSLEETNGIGDNVSSFIQPGTVKFGFGDSNGGLFLNGDAQTGVLGFAIMPGQTNDVGTFDYIIGFNDTNTGDADYDDFVIGVKFVAAAVPEPETYALMLAGLGILGFTARARRSKKD
jgi:hypothetical protein